RTRGGTPSRSCWSMDRASPLLPRMPLEDDDARSVAYRRARRRPRPRPIPRGHARRGAPGPRPAAHALGQKDARAGHSLADDPTDSCRRGVHTPLTRTPSYNSGVRVLVVEDEQRMAMLLGRGFREAGYAVDEARDGTDGLWLATQNDYDAIVLDVLLPGVDGLELCRRLRAAERWAAVLLLAGLASVDDRVRGLHVGADDSLTKPFSFAELAARVRALVRRRTSARP